MLVKTNPQTAKQVMEVAKDNHWRFKPLVEADMIDIPVYYDEWWFIPEHEDTSIIPYEATRRVDALRQAGVNVVGTIVAHEAPKLLAPPPKPKREIKVNWSKYGQIMATVIGAIASATAAVFMVFGYVMLAVLTDPCLIAVIEDDDGRRIWVEVASWYE